MNGAVVVTVSGGQQSWTAAAVGARAAATATIRVPVSREGYQGLRQFARRWPGAEWAIEGAAGLGAPLITRLSTDGITATDVPAKLATRVRMLSTGHGRKSDDADAVSVGVAALTASGLRSVAVDEAITALRALVEHRDDMVKSRTQTVNRLHVLLTQLLPAGASRNLRRPRPRNCCAPSARAAPVRAPCAGWPSSSSRRSATSTGASRRPPPRSAPPLPASGTTLTELRGDRRPDRREDPRPRR